MDGGEGPAGAAESWGRLRAWGADECLLLEREKRERGGVGAMIGAAANVQRVCMDACGERGDVRSKTPCGGARLSRRGDGGTAAGPDRMQRTAGDRMHSAQIVVRAGRVRR